MSNEKKAGHNWKHFLPWYGWTELSSNQCCNNWKLIVEEDQNLKRLWQRSKGQGSWCTFMYQNIAKDHPCAGCEDKLPKKMSVLWRAAVQRNLTAADILEKLLDTFFQPAFLQRTTNLTAPKWTRKTKQQSCPLVYSRIQKTRLCWRMTKSATKRETTLHNPCECKALTIMRRKIFGQSPHEGSCFTADEIE